MAATAPARKRLAAGQLRLSTATTESSQAVGGNSLKSSHQFPALQTVRKALVFRCFLASDLNSIRRPPLFWAVSDLPAMIRGTVVALVGPPYQFHFAVALAPLSSLLLAPEQALVYKGKEMNTSELRR